MARNVANPATVLWSRTIGGALSQKVDAIAVDGDGNLIIVGTFDGTVAFGDNDTDQLSGNPRWQIAVVGTGDSAATRRAANDAHVWAGGRLSGHASVTDRDGVDAASLLSAG